MKKPLIIVIVLITAAILFTLAYTHIPIQENTLELQATTLSHGQIDTKEFTDSITIVTFFASWCPPCRAEMPVLDELYKNNSAKVIGVNLGEQKEVVESFIAELNVSFPIVLDPDEVYKKQFNVITQPATYFIYPNQSVAYQKLGALTEQELDYVMNKITTN